MSRELNDDDIAKLRMILSSSAWNDVMKPAMAGRIQVLVAMLVLPLEERGDKPMTDDSIRGGIREIQWCMNKFEQVVQQYDHNQRIDQRDAEMAAASP